MKNWENVTADVFLSICDFLSLGILDMLECINKDYI